MPFCNDARSSLRDAARTLTLRYRNSQLMPQDLSACSEPSKV
ncbi:hypothetical protein GXM_08007 [Nostoc sphaeroides CCNUC1]|uniref:Uncharacterized protein n=1 Tax=Nostoc sphaeroides CCNUC1 TaxID=2653204 RepID=A0A5P8WCH4_9NOSO|nr:hypothetical protein GXM_08007 [Nostoc sphaeroides CCNUC1]